MNQNTAEEGGGVCNGGVVTIANTTINENVALFSGGGIHNTGIMNWSNSLITNSPAGGDCYNIGTIPSNNNNLVEDGSCSAVFYGDPFLGPLQDNGGSPWTQALLDASPAVDAGENASCLMTDQRGIKRPQDGNGDGSAVCDIGAFEIGYYQLYLPVIVKLNLNRFSALLLAGGIPSRQTILAYFRRRRAHKSITSNSQINNGRALCLLRK
jgi:hypothetical protein